MVEPHVSEAVGVANIGSAWALNGRGTWHRAHGRLGCVRNADRLRGSRGVAAEVGRRPGAHMHHRAGPAAAVHIGQRGRAARIRSCRRGEDRHRRTFNGRRTWHRAHGRLGCVRNADCLRGSRGVAAEVGRRPGAHMHHRAGPAAAVHIGQRGRAARIRRRRRGEDRHRRTLNGPRTRHRADGCCRVRNVIVFEAVEVLPQSSAAVQVRTCTTGQVPLLLSTKVSVAVPHESEAVGVAKTGTAGHSIVLGAGSAEIVGFVCVFRPSSRARHRRRGVVVGVGRVPGPGLRAGAAG